MEKIKWYSDRRDRSRFLAERFSAVLSAADGVLDVGCHERDLKEFLPAAKRYKGIDIGGKPDVFIDLDRIDRLPFADREFDAVVCADVLEHLENIHLIFDELLRVAKKNVVITLPSPANINVIKILLLNLKYADSPDKRKNFGKNFKYYGLPLEKPEDRHRWFFSCEEAKEFISYRAQLAGFEIASFETNLDYVRISNPFKRLISLFSKRLLATDLVILLSRK